MKKLFIVALLLSLSACTVMESEPTDTASSSSRSSSVALGRGTFEVNDNGGSGTLIVRGYPRVAKVNEAFCDTDCPQFDYVFFQVLETGNENFETWYTQNEGNSYLGKMQIGLGCEENGTITYWNHSDKNGMKEFTLPAGQSLAILQATEQNPVNLKLTKLPLDGGMGAPTCYSHFTTIEIAELSSTAL